MRPAPGTTLSLSATSAVGESVYLRHLAGRVVVAALSGESPESDRLDATWRVAAPLASEGPDERPRRISLESVNFPGGYVRHRLGLVYQEPGDGSEQFARDATFRVLGFGTGIALAAVDYPESVLRHYHGEVYLATRAGGQEWEGLESWNSDVTWYPVDPLA